VEFFALGSNAFAHMGQVGIDFFFADAQFLGKISGITESLLQNRDDLLSNGCHDPKGKGQRAKVQERKSDRNKTVYLD